MTTKAKKWGNSFAFRVPKAVVVAAGISENCEYQIRVEAQRIVLTPQRKRSYSLRQLLDQVRPCNLHAAEEFGLPVGAEIW